MIFSFEASVVFQRIKNLNTLKGMDNREIDVHVFRGGRYILNPTEPSTWDPSQQPLIPDCVETGGRWEETKTTELVPGDLFSLTRTKVIYSG